MLTLGERPSEDLFVGFNEVAFTPDGHHALIDYLLPDFGQQVLELAFDEGVPKPVERVKNLPNWGIYSTPVFSHDSARALVFESSSGAYLLDLTGPAAVPTPLSVPTFDGWDLTFCQADDSWVQATSTSTLYSLVGGEPLPTPLDGEVVAVSPDGLRVWVRGINARLVSCAAGFEQGPSGLPDAGGTWSPDSRWLLASLEDGSGKLFSFSAALETTEVWSNHALDHAYWSSDGRAVLLRLVGGTEPTFVYLDLTGEVPVEHPLHLAPDASIGSCSARGCLVFVPRLAEDGVDLLWQPFAADSAPSLLAAQLSSESALVWADFERNLLFLKRASADGSQLTFTDFQASSERAVFDWPGSSIEARPASDGSGVLLQTSVETGYENFWLPLPDAGADVDASVVPLDVPSYRSAFQPWSRRR
jgi:hypothetical protein